MHGRPRETKVLTIEEKKAKLEKLDKYIKLKDAILAKNSKGASDPTSFALVGKMIEINPDFYTAWNYRKKILQHYITEGKTWPELRPDELALTFEALKKNPKSYYAWHHRIWILTQGGGDMEKEFQTELAHCDHMLKLDPRNFHCWNYRRYIANCIGVNCWRGEFEFTLEKINENFSNYSAWHYRSALLVRLYPPHNHDQLDKEFELVKQAFYTDPFDQSAWLYHRWLLSRVGVIASAKFTPHGTGGCTVVCLQCGRPFTSIEERIAHQHNTKHLSFIPSSRGTTSMGATELTHSDMHVVAEEIQTQTRWQREVVSRELAICEDLMTIEPNCKWVLLTTALLLCAHRTNPEKDVNAIAKRVGEIFTKLVQIDPLRKNYYLHMQQTSIDLN